MKLGNLDKRKIIGEEFTINFGGWSHLACPKCFERLAVHISHKDEKKPRRYFCAWCGVKMELLPPRKNAKSKGTFLPVYNGEFSSKPGNRPFFNPASEGVID